MTLLFNKHELKNDHFLILVNFEIGYFKLPLFEASFTVIVNTKPTRFSKIRLQYHRFCRKQN